MGKAHGQLEVRGKEWNLGVQGQALEWPLEFPLEAGGQVMG